MDKNCNIFNYLYMFCLCLIYVKKLPEDDLKKSETCGSFDGLYVKIYIIFTCSVSVGMS